MQSLSQSVEKQLILPTPFRVLCVLRAIRDSDNTFQLRCKPDMKHNHIKTISEIVIGNAGTKQLARTFPELTTRKIEVNQMRLSRLRLAPRPEIG